MESNSLMHKHEPDTVLLGHFSGSEKWLKILIVKEVISLPRPVENFSSIS